MKVKRERWPAVETKGADRRAKSQIGIEAKRLLRCPACFRVDGVPLLHFTCTLARCPKMFANIEPPRRSRRSLLTTGQTLPHKTAVWCACAAGGYEKAGEASNAVAGSPRSARLSMMVRPSNY